MNNIHISLNELENAVYKSLESLKYNIGFCEALSKDVTFLETIGLQALSQFVAFLSSHKNVSKINKHFIITPPNNEENPAYIFDCNHVSCIHFIEPWAEYIISLVNKISLFTVLFQNSYDYIFLIPYLQRISDTPLNIQWYEKKRDRYNIAFIFPENNYPEFYFNIPENLTTDMKTMLVTYTSAEQYNTVKSHYTCACLSMLERQECARCFGRSITEGLYVDKDQWNIIKTFGKAVLVPSNHVSRSSAGEIADSIDTEDMLFKST